MLDYFSLINPLLKLCTEVGLYITQCYNHRDSISSLTKADKTPVTHVDIRSHEMIAAGLTLICPDIPILSEESPSLDLNDRLDWDQLWLVDPLDGTKEFLSKTGDFSINIALIEQGRPVLGVIYQPLLEICYAGLVGSGAWRFSSGDSFEDGEEVKARSINSDSITVLSSRDHSGAKFEQYLNWLKTRSARIDLLKHGAAIKFIKLAHGEADVYPRFSICSEWDVAAGDAMLHAAGGGLLGFDGLPLKYNSRQSLLSDPFIAFGDPNFPVWFESLEIFSD